MKGRIMAEQNVVHTQGTHLYVVDTSGATAKLAQIDCVKSITGLGSGTSSKIDVTRLSDTGSRRQVSGLSDPESISIPYQFDTSENNHRLFEALKGKNVQWMFLMSDGEGVPTLDTASGKMTAPTTRTGASFVGFIEANAIEWAENEVVRGTLTIARSGNIEYSYKA